MRHIAACGDSENAGTNTVAATKPATGTAANPTDGGFCEAMAHLNEYVHYLSTGDSNLDTVFSTPKGKQLAIDTSHTLAPVIVKHVVDERGLSFGDEQHDPPVTTTE